MEEYDVIIVGQGCVGTSTAYYCAKKGLKVLGLEMFSRPGSLGSSSFGETRLWRISHNHKVRNDMMKAALKLYEEIEEETGEKLLEHFPVFTMGSVKSRDFQMIVSQFPLHVLLTPEEIMEKYPALKNVPGDYKGLITDQGGIVRARKALELLSRLAQDKYGARLIFNTKVRDVTKNSVTTEDGATYTAKHVIVAAGAYSKKFDEERPSVRREIEYFVFDDPSGLPKGILEYDEHGMEYYGMLDGENLDHYKMGEWGPRNLKSITNYLRERLPSKFDKIKYVNPCYITMIETEEFQYKTSPQGVHYAYGFSGTGFKFLPLHGKIVYDGLIHKNDETFIPEKFRAKM